MLLIDAKLTNTNRFFCWKYYNIADTTLRQLLTISSNIYVHFCNVKLNIKSIIRFSFIDNRHISVGSV